MDKPTQTPETIYLIPDASEGVLSHVWCDDPAPGIGMDPDDAIKYRRADVADTALAAAEARIAELEKALGPFAREAGTWGEHEDETEIVKTCNQTSFFPINSTFTVGDLRQADALLKEKE